MGKTLEKGLKDGGAEHVLKHPDQAFKEFAEDVEKGDDWMAAWVDLFEKLATNVVAQVETPEELRAYALRAGEPVMGQVTDESYYEGMKASGSNEMIPQTIVADPREATIDANGNVQGVDERKVEDVLDRDEFDGANDLDDIVNSDSMSLASVAPTTSISTGVDLDKIAESIKGEIPDVSQEEVRKMINSASNWNYEESKKIELAQELWDLLNVQAYIDAGGTSNFDDSVDGGYFRDNVMEVEENAKDIAESDVAMGMVFAADEV